MKRIFTTILLSVTLLSAEAQIEKLAGPRVGVTMITPGSLASIIRGDVSFFSDEVRQEWTGSTGKYGAAISQYGWQWESRFADGGNVTGIVEWIALVGGMEKGFFLPSVSSMVGLRTDKGIEFAVGPNVSLGGIAMVFGAGYNFKFGKLNVPVNIAYVPSMNKTYHHEAEYDHTHMWDDEGNSLEPVLESPAYSVTHPTGARISVMVGFNIGK
ncbi:MAG: hypothetical protein P8P67_04755 [Flavobacteriales bacterium]|jgi:hypothetical protein|nr:hypothetical protein [Flavobacteriales bacterium]